MTSKRWEEIRNEIFKANQWLPVSYLDEACKRIAKLEADKAELVDALSALLEHIKLREFSINQRQRLQQEAQALIDKTNRE